MLPPWWQLIFSSKVPCEGSEKFLPEKHLQMYFWLWGGVEGRCFGGFGVYVLNELACMRLLPHVSKLNHRGFKSRKHLLFPLLLPTTFPAGGILLAKIAD